MLNNQLTTIKIRKRSVQEWMVLGFFLMPFMLALLTEVLGLPSFLRYFMDVALIFLGALLFFRKQFTIAQKLKPLFWLVIIFFVYSLVVYLFNFQSPFYFVWGTRNMFRFYLAVLVFVAYVSQNEAGKWLELLDVLFWLNLAAVTYQFIFLPVHQDYLGGIFGVSSRTTGYTLIFFFIVIGRSLLRAFEGEESYIYCALKCLASFVVSAMAEIKFYFMIFIVMLIVAACLTRFTKKKVVFLVFAIITAISGASLLTFWYSEFSDFLSWETVLEMATKENYSSGRDLNRLSAISTLMKKYVVGLDSQLFGMGLGNCDMSDVPIFNSEFYQSYSFLHYTWFAFAFIFLETGFIGLGMYLAYFVFCIIFSYKQIKSNTGNKLFCRLAILMAILSIILTFYNASLRTEAGYMVYFVLSLPFLSASSKTEKIATV